MNLMMKSTHAGKSGTNLLDVQEMNRSLIIRLLHKNGVCSRADLAKATGLKQATITNIINSFIGAGIVKETGIIEGEKGRRSIGVSLNGTDYKLIGVRLARKYLKVGLFDIEGTLYYKKKVDIKITATPEDAIIIMKSLITDILKNNDNGSILGIGVALPGPFFRQEGRIVLMTEFSGWEKINIQDELSSTFQIPVYVEHDANCGVLAEWLYGAHKNNHGTLMYVAAGQGIGAGIIVDGKLYTGTLGTAGEIGHMSISFDGPKCECGNRGCLELYCSTIALLRKIKKERINFEDSILQEDCTLNDVFDALKKEDKLAKTVVDEVVWFLSFGLASVANTLNPDTIIIGDELSNAGDYLLNSVKCNMKKLLLPQIYENIKIDLSSFDGDPILIGASALAIDSILNKPSLLFNSK